MCLGELSISSNVMKFNDIKFDAINFILRKKDVAEEVYFAVCGTYDCYDNTLPYDMAPYRVEGR